MKCSKGLIMQGKPKFP